MLGMPSIHFLSIQVQLRETFLLISLKYRLEGRFEVQRRLEQLPLLSFFFVIPSLMPLVSRSFMHYERRIYHDSSDSAVLKLITIATLLILLPLYLCTFVMYVLPYLMHIFYRTVIYNLFMLPYVVLHISHVTSPS